jgi:hypothetical protein
VTGVGAAFLGIVLRLGMEPTAGFLVAAGVTVALGPEGLLPTVTPSPARRLEAVQTLG